VLSGCSDRLGFCQGLERRVRHRLDGLIVSDDDVVGARVVSATLHLRPAVGHVRALLLFHGDGQDAPVKQVLDMVVTEPAGTASLKDRKFPKESSPQREPSRQQPPPQVSAIRELFAGFVLEPIGLKYSFAGRSGISAREPIVTGSPTPAAQGRTLAVGFAKLSGLGRVSIGAPPAR
jgi:hypothetical protein